jgi:hypothetical protein
MNPYILPMQQPQDIGGLSPYFQNIAQQQAMQNMAMQQNQGLNQAIGQTQGGMNPMAMAAMLRNKDPQSLANKLGNYASSIPQMMQYGAENVYGGFGQGKVPTTSTGMD